MNEAIADEVRKDQGETPTFPFSEREFAEKSVGETGDDAMHNAREKAEIERVPGGGTPRAPDNSTDPVPPVKEPPKDDIGDGPLPSDDIREPEPDPKKIAQKPTEDPLAGENVPDGLQNLNSV